MAAQDNIIQFETDNGTISFSNRDNTSELTYEKIHDQLKISIPYEMVVLVTRDNRNPGIIISKREKLEKKFYRIESVKSLYDERNKLIEEMHHVCDLASLLELKMNCLSIDISAICQELKRKFGEMTVQIQDQKKQIFTEKSQTVNEGLAQEKILLTSQMEQITQLTDQVENLKLQTVALEIKVQEAEDKSCGLELQSNADRESFQVERSELIQKLQELQAEKILKDKELKEIKEMYLAMPGEQKG